MKFLPFDVFAIQTELSIPDLMERLNRYVEPWRFVRGAGDYNDFEGQVNSAGFSIKPILHSQTVFLPEVHGRLVRQGHGTMVIVQMIPNCGVLTMIMLFGCYLGFHLFDTEALRVIASLASAAVVDWTVSLIGFWIDGGRSKRRLVEILTRDRTGQPHVEDRAVAKSA